MVSISNTILKMYKMTAECQESQHLAQARKAAKSEAFFASETKDQPEVTIYGSNVCPYTQKTMLSALLLNVSEITE